MTSQLCLNGYARRGSSSARTNTPPDQSFTPPGTQFLHDDRHAWFEPLRIKDRISREYAAVAALEQS